MSFSQVFRSPMPRSYEQELLDADNLSDEAVAKAYRQLQMVHGWLGNTRAVLRRLRTQQAGNGTSPPVRVLDVGCGQGALLRKVRDRLGFDVVGMDLRPAPLDSEVPILTGNAVTDPLPTADVAVCMMMAHHLSGDELACLIRNVSRSCDRLIVLDLVRSPVPLVLFQVFVAPLLCRINALDGQTSIRRAFTVGELKKIVDQALAGEDRPVRSVLHKTSAFWTRQLVDIVWETRR